MKKITTTNFNQLAGKLVVDNFDDFLIISKHILKGKMSWLAEDAAQTSRLKALEKIHTFQGPIEKYNSWIYRIVHNTCMDMARKSKKELTVETVFTNRNEFMFHSEISEATFSKEDYRRLRIAISKLNCQDRKLIILKNTFKLSGKEIGEFLDIPSKNVTTYYLRAKRKLAQMILV